MVIFGKNELLKHYILFISLIMHCMFKRLIPSYCLGFWDVNEKNKDFVAVK